MVDHDVIYLSPECDEATGEGRTWAVDCPWDACECDGSPHKPVKYVRADAPALAKIAALVERRGPAGQLQTRWDIPQIVTQADCREAATALSSQAQALERALKENKAHRDRDHEQRRADWVANNFQALLNRANKAELALERVTRERDEARSLHHFALALLAEAQRGAEKAEALLAETRTVVEAAQVAVDGGYDRAGITLPLLRDALAQLAEKGERT